MLPSPNFPFCHLPSPSFPFIPLPSPNMPYLPLPSSTFPYLPLPSPTFPYLPLPSTTFNYLHLPDHKWDPHLPTIPYLHPHLPYPRKNFLWANGRKNTSPCFFFWLLKVHILRGPALWASGRLKLVKIICSDQICNSVTDYNIWKKIHSKGTF